MKKVFCYITVVAVMLSCFTSFCYAEVTEKTTLPDIAAQNVYMVNTNTGAVVYEKAADERVYPASLTKLATMLVAVDLITDYNEVVTVTDKCYDDLVIGSSSINLKDGEEITFDDMLYALALSSANEAANMLAIRLCGNIEDFVDKMNEKAALLGAENTHFVNTHGLHSEEHYTTAHDMGLIAAAAFSNETIMGYLSTSVHEIAPTNKTSEKRTLVTTNTLLRKNTDLYYKYCKAGKTGTTTPAGYNLVSIADKADTVFILVAMHADKAKYSSNPIFSDSRKLYNWAYENYKSVRVIKDSEVITEVEVQLSAKGDHLILIPQKSVYSIVPVDLDVDTLERRVTTQEKIFAPVAEGDALGTLTLTKDGITYASVDLVAAENVDRSTVLYYLHLIEQFFANIWVRIICALLLILLVLYVILMISQNRRRRRRKLRKRIRF